jgi:hypothetical protein
LSAGRRAVEDFAQSFDTAAKGTGFDELHAKLLKLGDAGEQLWIKLTQKTKKGDKKAAQAVMDEITEAFAGLDKADAAVKEMADEAAAAGFKTQEQQQAIATKAVKLWEYMRDSGKFAAADVQKAWEAAQAALAESGDATAIAFEKNKTALGELTAEFDKLFESVKDEAPEEVMGDVEKAARARMDAIAEQKKALEAQMADATAAAAESTADAAAQTQTAAADTTDAIDTMASGVLDAADDFEEFARRAGTALRAVQSEVDAISFGHSPGGLKQIPMEFAKSMAAARDFERQMSGVSDLLSGDVFSRPVRATVTGQAASQHAVASAAGALPPIHIAIDRPILKDRASMQELTLEVASRLKRVLNPVGAWT